MSSNNHKKNPHNSDITVKRNKIVEKTSAPRIDFISNINQLIKDQYSHHSSDSSSDGITTKHTEFDKVDEEHFRISSIERKRYHTEKLQLDNKSLLQK